MPLSLFTNSMKEQIWLSIVRYRFGNLPNGFADLMFNVTDNFH